MLKVHHVRCLSLPLQALPWQRKLVVLLLLIIAIPLTAPAVTIRINKPFTDEDLECLTSSNDAIFIGGEDEHVFTSRDGGLSWEERKMRGVDGSICAILYTSDNAVVVAANSWDDHFLALSTDRGVSWHRVWRDADIMVKTLFESGGGTAIAIGDEPQYVRSVGGSRYDDWQEIYRPWRHKGGLYGDIDVQDSHTFGDGDVLLVGESAFSACYDRSFITMRFICPMLNEGIDYTRVGFMDDAVGCVGSDEGQLFRTTDRGRSWTAVYHGTTHISGVAFNRAGNGVVVGHNGLLLVTVDGGTMWTPLSSGTDLGINNVELLRDGRFVAVGDDGLWMYIEF